MKQQNAQPAERRRVQRVRLQQPLRARVGETRVFIVDLSLRGLRVMHQEDLGSVGSPCVVRTEWDGHAVILHCKILRTTIHRPGGQRGATIYHSGLAITEASKVATLNLRRLIEHHVERALDEQKANARGVPPPLAAQSVPTGAPSAFVRHEYVLGRWREVMTASPAQPDDGFTISAQTTPMEVEMLRKAYETATTAAELTTIRRLAALSVSSGEIIPARRYLP